MEKKENQRVMLTKRLLKEALLRLLEKKELGRISVSELCREADINRATFYKHYETCRDVLLDVETDVVADLRNITGHLSLEAEGKRYLEGVCRYVQEHAGVVKLLMSNNSDLSLELLFSSLNQSIWEEHSNPRFAVPLDENGVELLTAFLGHGCYHLIRQWLCSSMNKTPEEIADLVYQLFDRNYRMR